MGIPKFDFSVKQGNSGTIENPAGLVVTIQDDEGQPRDLSGAEVVFYGHWDNQTHMRLTSALGEINLSEPEGRVTVPFAVDAFRTVSTRKTVRYELELRQAGEQRTVLEGLVNVIEGLNDD
ncbi:MAG: hypothetical protein AAGI03_10975 [Pseudomonadota bacterium]